MPARKKLYAEAHELIACMKQHILTERQGEDFMWGRAVWGRAVWGRAVWGRAVWGEQCGGEQCGGEQCGGEQRGGEQCGNWKKQSRNITEPKVPVLPYTIIYTLHTVVI